MNTQPEPSGERLTEAASLRQLLSGIAFTLLIIVLALQQASEKKTVWAMVYATAGIGRMLMLPSYWIQYRVIKQGGVVYLPKPVAQAKPPSGWLLTFFVVVLVVLTASVTCVGIISFVLLHSIHGWQPFLFAGAVNVGLWLYVVHCWRRILFPKPQVIETVDYGEPQEGVWPPPPQHPF